MWESIANLLYPPACLLCHHRVPATTPAEQAGVTASRTPVCDVCERAMPVQLPPVCQRCGVGLPGAYDAQGLCQRCREHPLAFEKACAPFLYERTAREAIHAFKYRGRHRIGRWLAEHMARTAERELPLSQISTILPVPMHWVKQRLKGINPAMCLAQAVAHHLEIPCELSVLSRTRWTPTQTRLTLSQRFRNVQGAFRAHSPSLRDQAVLLVDDVLTSGATVHACSVALRQARATTVLVLTAACAPRP